MIMMHFARLASSIIGVGEGGLGDTKSVEIK